MSETSEGWKKYSIIRFVYCLLVIYGIIAYSRGYDLYFEFYLFPRGLTSFYFADISTFRALRICLIICLFLGGIGNRYFQLITCVLFAIYQYEIDFYLLPYTTNLSFFVLGAVFFAGDKETFIGLFRRNKSLGFSDYIYLILSLQYLAACVSKIRFGGSGWLDGSLVSAYFVESSFWINGSISRFIGDSVWLSKVISLTTLFFEGFFFVGLFNISLRKYFLLAGVFFHFAIFYTMKINFFVFYLPAYLFFVPEVLARYKLDGLNFFSKK